MVLRSFFNFMTVMKNNRDPWLTVFCRRMVENVFEVR